MCQNVMNSGFDFNCWNDFVKVMMRMNGGKTWWRRLKSIKGCIWCRLWRNLLGSWLTCASCLVFFVVTQERAKLNTASGQCQEHWHQAFLGLVTCCSFLSEASMRRGTISLFLCFIPDVIYSWHHFILTCHTSILDVFMCKRRHSEEIPQLTIRNYDIVYYLLLVAGIHFSSYS